MHLNPAHDCDTQFQKLEHREKIVRQLVSPKQIRTNQYKLEHVAKSTRTPDMGTVPMSGVRVN